MSIIPKFASDYDRVRNTCCNFNDEKNLIFEAIGNKIVQAPCDQEM